MKGEDRNMVHSMSVPQLESGYSSKKRQGGLLRHNMPTSGQKNLLLASTQDLRQTSLLYKNELDPSKV